MKNERILQKNNKRLLFFTIPLFCIVFIFSAFACTYSIFRGSGNRLVYADYINDIVAQQNVVVNFNQISNEIGIQHDGTFGSSGFNNHGVSYFPGSLDNTHYYLVKFYYVVNSGTVNYLGLFSQDYTYEIFSNVNDGYSIITDWSSIALFRAYGTANTNYDFTAYISIIDLTLMFGEGNEPNLNQCKGLFTSQYYPYNSGTAINFNALDSWAQGYAEGVGSQDVVFSGSILQTNINVSSGGIYTKDNARYINMWNNNDSYNEFYFNFPTSLNNNDTVSVSIEHLEVSVGTITQYPNSSSVPASFNISLGYYDNGNYIALSNINENSGTIHGNLYSYEGNWYRAYKNVYVSFKCPIELQRIYFRYDKISEYFDLAIKAQSTNFAFALQQAQDRGYEIAKQYYTEGEGYEQITLEAFNNGVSSAQSNVSVFQDSWSFIASAFSSIGEMLSIQIFPNVPLGVFVALPLLLGLILFIVKLTKGG